MTAHPDALRAGLELLVEVLADHLDELTASLEVRQHEGLLRRDLQESYDDLWRLSAGHDARYDLHWSGALYASWYQLQRVAHAVGVLDPLLRSEEGEIDIVDIGCGTGATAWAIAVIERARRDAGLRPRRIRVRGVDGSPSMIRAAGQLWDRLSSCIDLDGMAAEFILSSWRNVASMDLADGLRDPILVGGYVFDHSDATAAEELTDDLESFVEAQRARAVILFGAAGKQGTVLDVMRSLAASQDGAVRWSLEDGRFDRTFVPRDAPGAVDAARRRLLEAAGVVAQDRKGVSWGFPSESTYALLRRTGQLGMSLGGPTRIVLDRAQRIASRPDGDPTLVIGAAGSGKSEVLVHRIVATIEGIVRGGVRRHHGGRQRVLVTAHNKYMLDHLIARVEQELTGRHDRLDVSYDACPLRCEPCVHEPKDEGAVDCWLQVGSDVNGVTARFINWDKVFTRILKVAPKGRSPSGFLRHATAEDRLTLHSKRIDDAYLSAEFNRVIYGQRVQSNAEYATMNRRGRSGERLPRRSDVRQAVWRTIDPRSERAVRREFTNVRYDGLIGDARPAPSELWDHVFVDEGQDFSDGDFEILARLAVDPGGVVVALDPTQSQYLGAAFRMPGRLNVAGPDGSRRNWTRHHLARTHRLSISISRAIQPVAAGISSEREDIISLEPRKSAVIGARPIIVEARNERDVERVLAVLRDQAGFLGIDPVKGRVGRRTLLFAGKHPWYHHLEEGLARSAQEDLKVLLASSEDRSSYHHGEWKGLEFDGVIWLTAATLGRPEQTVEAAAEWVYTVLSRARSLLVIVLTPDTDPETRRLVALMDPEHLRFWGESAQREFLAWRTPVTEDIPF